MRLIESTQDVKHFTFPGTATGVRDRYISIRNYTTEICKPLNVEDYVVQPAEFVSPPKWHLAHSTFFFEEYILCRYFGHYTRFNRKFLNIFQDDDKNATIQRNLSRPTVEEVLDYRKHVDAFMLTVIDHLYGDALAMLELGLYHEQRHQELLFTDIKYILGHNPLFPAYKPGFGETMHTETDPEFTSIPEGEYWIGNKDFGFSHDSEYGNHNVILKSYQIRRSLVTNQEYLDFIKSGGYTTAELWHTDAWEWVNKNKIKAPLYWHSIDSMWHRYALSGLEPVDESEPVTHVSYYEANAFANWMGMRLPTEFEWEAAADQFNWGQRWEHTNSAYLPYPGYVKPQGMASEFTANFMVNNMVLRGSSMITPPNYSRKSYRNYCYPDLRWQFTGIRLCKGSNG
jgi:ergothioneine biosynthesis protein EgtB